MAVTVRYIRLPTAASAAKVGHMGGKPRSLRQAQSLLAGQLRAHGRTWAEIAAEFRAAYRVNARVPRRQAHGGSQPQPAARWTARWPDDPKTFKNFSYWELWPGGTGHAPSLDTLEPLALWAGGGVKGPTACFADSGAA